MMELSTHQTTGNANIINISTHDFTITVRQNLLTESSHFFKAALQSGMSESRSGEFFLPEFSPRQLQHLQHFLSNTDLLTTAMQPLQSEHTNGSNTTGCTWEESVRRLIEAAFIADYLQMPPLKSKLYRLFQQLLQSLQQQSVACFSRLHDCNTFAEMLPIFSDHRLKCLKKPLLEFIYRHPSTVVRPKFIRVDVTQASLIRPIIECLTSDRVFFKTEDEMANIICEWSQLSSIQPKRRRNEDEFSLELLQSFMASIRLGLLSTRGLQCLLNLFTERPEYTAADSKLSGCFSAIRSLFAYKFRSYFQTALSAHHLTPPLDVSAFRPRANTPTMVLIARQNSSTCCFVMFFLDLLHGNVLSIPTPLSVERTLLFEPSESNPIHIATAETANCQNLVFLFIHQINTATLKGLIWDLATLEAEWLPELDLKHSSFDWASDSFSTFSLPHTVGIVYTPDGLMVYCSFTLSEEAVICVYGFDVPSWSWIKYFPKAYQPGPLPMLLKPMPHATPLGDRWLYGALDWGEGGQFIRMRPSSARGSGDYTIQVETLAPPEFILRAYNLVSVRTSAPFSTESANEDSENAIAPRDIYTFPFNACQRDTHAMSTCFSQTQNRWCHWEPADLKTPTSSQPAPSEHLTFSLLRNHIGFRGVVCTSSLPISLPRQPKQADKDEEALLEEEDFDVAEKPPPNSQTHLASGSYFVMAGRLSQPVYPPSAAISGLWLIDPLQRSCGLPRQPTFTVPPELDNLLHRATAVGGTVALANWTAVEAAVVAATSAAAATSVDPVTGNSNSNSNSNNSTTTNVCNLIPSMMPIMRFTQRFQLPTNVTPSLPPGYSQPYRHYGGGGSDSD